MDEPQVPDEPIVEPITFEKVERAVQTDKRVSQKQLDALAKGRALNIERRKKYIEFEKLQKLQQLQPLAPAVPLPPPIVRDVPVRQSYALDFV
jgi:hypothetical protein